MAALALRPQVSQASRGEDVTDENLNSSRSQPGGAVIKVAGALLAATVLAIALIPAARNVAHASVASTPVGRTKDVLGDDRIAGARFGQSPRSADDAIAKLLGTPSAR